MRLEIVSFATLDIENPLNKEQLQTINNSQNLYSLYASSIVLATLESVNGDFLHELLACKSQNLFTL